MISPIYEVSEVYGKSRPKEGQDGMTEKEG